jgi:hypothetical protein
VQLLPAAVAVVLPLLVGAKGIQHVANPGRSGAASSQRAGAVPGC